MGFSRARAKGSRLPCDAEGKRMGSWGRIKEKVRLKMDGRSFDFPIVTGYFASIARLGHGPRHLWR
jgi:hypothetical protein